MHGQILLFPEPVRYVNHCETRNTAHDHDRQVYVALRPIAAGEAITVDARLDDVPALTALDALVVRVPSVREGLDFYREQLGLQTVWVTADEAAVRLGDGLLVLSTRPTARAVVGVESVDDAARVVSAAGGRVVRPAAETSDGRRGTLSDPFGNEFIVAERLG